MNIARHLFTVKKLGAIPVYRELVEKIFIRLRANQPIKLPILKSRSLGLVRAIIINSKEKNSICEELNIVLDAGLGHFKRRIATSLLSIRLGSNEFELAPIRDDIGVAFNDWIDLFNMAQLLRSKEYLQELLNLQEVFDLNQEDTTLWRYAVQFSMALMKEDKEQLDELIDVLRKKANAEEYLFVGLEETKMVSTKVDSIIESKNVLRLPLYELYYLAYYKKTKEFNERLEIYLQTKKDYIIKTESEDYSTFWVDFNALGICAYASDRGIKITVESDYIPQWVYNGSFCIEE